MSPVRDERNRQPTIKQKTKLAAIDISNGVSRWAKVAAILMMGLWLWGQEKDDKTESAARAIRERIDEIAKRLDKELPDTNKALNDFLIEVINADKVEKINPILRKALIEHLTKTLGERKTQLRETHRKIRLLADELGITLVDTDEQKTNESLAYKTLKTIFEAEALWHKLDIDRNGIPDYWTLDVAGLFYARRFDRPDRFDKSEAMLIDIKTAKSDPSADNWRNSGLPVPHIPTPHFGYYFTALQKDGDGDPYSKITTTEDLDGTGFPHNASCTNATRFGFVAYPAEYGVTGRLTFIINQWGTIFYKDTEGKPIRQWPTRENQDPSALLSDGWEFASYK